MTCFLFTLIAAAAVAQDFSDIKVEKVANGLHFAEGPAWSPEGFLVFSDTVTNKLHKFVPGKGDSELASVPGGPNGNAVRFAGTAVHLRISPAARDAHLEERQAGSARVAL